MNWLLQSLSLVFVATLLSATLAGCKSNTKEVGQSVVKVTALDYAFEAPDTVWSGWTTFRMTNEGQEHHHFHLFLLPDGKTFQDYYNEFITPYDSLRQLLISGRIDTSEMMNSIEQIVPDWADPRNLKKRGGIGALAPGHVGQTTLKLTPGTYVMDCAIRDSTGRPHNALGMAKPLNVIKSDLDTSPPKPDLNVFIDDQTIRSESPVISGKQRIAFRVKESEKKNNAYFVWLARLNDTTNVNDLIKWSNQDDFWNPPPANYLGGFEYLPTSQTAYITVNITPGRYAWHWGYLGEGFLGKEFKVD